MKLNTNSVNSYTVQVYTVVGTYKPDLKATDQFKLKFIVSIYYSILG